MGVLPTFPTFDELAFDKFLQDQFKDFRSQLADHYKFTVQQAVSHHCQELATENARLKAAIILFHDLALCNPGDLYASAPQQGPLRALLADAEDQNLLGTVHGKFLDKLYDGDGLAES